MATGAANPQSSHAPGIAGARPSPVSASVAHLNVKGTAMVASLASRSRTIESATRCFRSRRSAGQIYGHTAYNMPSSEPPPAVMSRLNAAVGRGWESVIQQARSDGPHRQTVEAPYRDSQDKTHPASTMPVELVHVFFAKSAPALAGHALGAAGLTDPAARANLLDGNSARDQMWWP